MILSVLRRKREGSGKRGGYFKGGNSGSKGIFRDLVFREVGSGFGGEYGGVGVVFWVGRFSVGFGC